MSLLPYLAIGIIAFSILMYVLLDGWDLGVGILFLIAPQERARDEMMRSIVPFWDGNETWLVFSGVTLFATFPTVYALALKTFYLPVMVLLIALVFRGLSFEFRPRAKGSRIFWNWCFALGSIVAAFSQGIILGKLLQGVMHAPYGHVFSTLFPPFCGVAMVGGYSLLGAAWLIYKTDGDTRAFGRDVSRAAWLLAIGTLFLAAIWAPMNVPEVAARWSAWPAVMAFMIIVVAIAVAALALWQSVRSSRSDLRPLQWAIVITILAFTGFGATVWPYALPYQISITQGAADKATLEFAMVGILIVLPLVLAYQLFAYRVFAGKVGQDGAAH
jgi:cytochrome d ubiquinol oxidase subunit II